MYDGEAAMAGLNHAPAPQRQRHPARVGWLAALRRLVTASPAIAAEPQALPLDTAWQRPRPAAAPERIAA
jgi:hypothetical protein